MNEQPAFYRPRHVVVLTHPNRNSFNGLVAEAYCDAVRHKGHEPIVRDLYRIGFDPVLREEERPRGVGINYSADVRFEHEALRGSDVFVLVYPIWFGMPPAMLKGYVDRVLGAGVTAEQLQTGAAGTLLKGKRLVSITSSGASKIWLNQQDQMESLRNVFGRYLVHGFGMRAYDDLHFGETTEGLEQEYIDPLLAEVRVLARSVCEAVETDKTTEHARFTTQR
jgi:NAD(P)H dehydrogenase (quinone)